MYVSGPALGDVGFSLKRPRWLKKLRPSKWKPKDFAKAAGVIAAGATAPLWAPVAAGAAARLLSSAGRAAAVKATQDRALLNRAASAIVSRPDLVPESFQPAQQDAPVQNQPSTASSSMPLLVGGALLLFLLSQRKGR